MKVVVRLGGVDRMCFRDPRRMMVVVGKMVVVVEVVLLGGVDRMCFRDPRKMMVVVVRIVDVTANVRRACRERLL